MIVCVCGVGIGQLQWVTHRCIPVLCLLFGGLSFFSLLGVNLVFIYIYTYLFYIYIYIYIL